MKRLILLMLVVSIAIFGCDRFERDFENVDRFIDEFRIRGTQSLRQDNISLMMSFFADNYLNNGVSKDSLATFFSYYPWTEKAEIIVTPVVGSRTRFNITVTDDGILTEDGLPFLTMWSDVARLVGSNYLWYGNQLEPIESNQVVIAQVFTELRCANCPNASDALHEIAETFPDNFIYLKYHVRNDSLSLYDSFAEERQYYNANVQPIVVFQGQTMVTGGLPAHTDRYAQIVQDLLVNDPEIALTNLEHTVNNRTISGSVVLNFAGLNPENLYLYYVVYEKETTATYQVGPSAGMLAKNVIRGRGRQPLNPVSGQRVNFVLEAEKHLDTDTYLVVWVQRIENINRQSPSDRILNAIRKELF